MNRTISFFLLMFSLITAVFHAGAEETVPDTSHKIHPEYARLMPKVIAVLPMDNLSLEPDVENFLYDEVYSRLKANLSGSGQGTVLSCYPKTSRRSARIVFLHSFGK